jgi:hypothetical protein
MAQHVLGRAGILSLEAAVSQKIRAVWIALRIASGDIGRHERDRLSVDQDVGLLEVAHLRVECEHDSAAQQGAPSAAVTDQVLTR